MIWIHQVQIPIECLMFPPPSLFQDISKKPKQNIWSDKYATTHPLDVRELYSQQYSDEINFSEASLPPQAP